MGRNRGHKHKIEYDKSGRSRSHKHKIEYDKFGRSRSQKHKIEYDKFDRSRSHKQFKHVPAKYSVFHSTVVTVDRCIVSSTVIQLCDCDFVTYRVNEL